MGKKIREARDAAGLTQRQLAERIGLHDAQSVSNYERGINDVPRERIRAISEVTGKPISFFVDDPEPAQALEVRLERLEERLDETIVLMTEAIELLRAGPRRKVSGH